MMKRLFIISLITIGVFLLFLSSCRGDKAQYVITFINHSEKQVWTYNNYASPHFYPETFEHSYLYSEKIVNTHDTLYMYPPQYPEQEYGWSFYLRDGDVFLFFIYDKSLKEHAEGETLEEFRQKYLLYSKSFTLEELQQMNWTVVYPPEE